jgi:hypothetical protein
LTRIAGDSGNQNKTSRRFGLKRFVGAPDIKRPVRRSMWLRRLFFVGLYF